MKYLSEFRSPEIVEALLKELRETVKGNWNIMEVCGGQTHPQYAAIQYPNGAWPRLPGMRYAGKPDR